MFRVIIVFMVFYIKLPFAISYTENQLITDIPDALDELILSSDSLNAALSKIKTINNIDYETDAREERKGRFAVKFYPEEDLARRLNKDYVRRNQLSGDDRPYYYG